MTWFYPFYDVYSFLLCKLDSAQATPHRCCCMCNSLQELDDQAKGYMIRSGIVVILRNATIKDGTVI